MSSTKLAAAALIAAALAAQGCGGSSKSMSQTSAGSQAAATTTATTAASETPTTPPLSRAALIAKADPICARVQAQRAAKHIKTRQAYLAAAAEVTHIENTANEELAKLNPPASLASSWRQMLLDDRTIASDIEQISQAIGLRRTPVNIIRNAEAARTQAAKLAHQAGFRDCGRL